MANAKSPLLVNGLLAKRGKLGAYVLVPLSTPKPALPELSWDPPEDHLRCRVGGRSPT